MPRVTSHKKNRAGKEYTCQICREPITAEPGQHVAEQIQSYLSDAAGAFGY